MVHSSLTSIVWPTACLAILRCFMNSRKIVLFQGDLQLPSGIFSLEPLSTNPLAVRFTGRPVSMDELCKVPRLPSSVTSFTQLSGRAFRNPRNTHLGELSSLPLHTLSGAQSTEVLSILFPQSIFNIGLPPWGVLLVSLLSQHSIKTQSTKTCTSSFGCDNTAEAQKGDLKSNIIKRIEALKPTGKYNQIEYEINKTVQQLKMEIEAKNAN